MGIRAWRQDVKKIRRRRIRQHDARQRQSETIVPPISSAQLTKLAEERTAALIADELAEQQRAETNRLWLAYDQHCLEAWTKKQTKLQQIEQSKKAERERIQAEFEARERKKTEQRLERIRIANEKERLHEVLLQRIDHYLLEDGPQPEELRQTTETNAGRELCRVFAKTGACRFGVKCSRNHRRPGISRLLLVPQFFLQVVQAEKRKDLNVAELDEPYNEPWRRAYADFFEDVLAEMEKFGAVTQFRVCRNSGASHLSGNLLVEFHGERDALRAQRQLNGRYYAGVMLQTEFGSIESWKSAVCGLSIANRCPKSAECNYLHVFPNPGNRFPFISNANVTTPHSGSLGGLKPRPPTALNWDNLDDLDKHRSRTSSKSRSKEEWRWSESPSRDVGTSCRSRSSRSRNSSQNRRCSERSSDERHQSRHSSRRRRD